MFCSAACFLHAQAPDPPAPVFPSDSKLPTEADSRELLQAVCPGRAELGPSIGCGKTCPSYTEFHGEPQEWSVKGVTRGHFLSATSDDAVLAVQGCEPHSNNFGGSILLTRQSDRWKMQWYKAGVITSKCRKILLLSGRELLACIGTSGIMGSSSTELYVEDLLRPAATLMAEDEEPFFWAKDNVRSCGYDAEHESKPYPVTYAFIEKVEFTPDVPAAISVTASYGRSFPTPASARACALDSAAAFIPGAIVPAVISYRLDFVFDGHDYKPAPASAATAALFASQ